MGDTRSPRILLAVLINIQRVRNVGVYEISVPKYVVAYNTLTPEYWEALKLYKYI
jgi:hypothetical protein